MKMLKRRAASCGVNLEISKETLLVKSNCVFLMGEGSRVKFYEDTWCGSNPLCTIFPHLYSLAGSKGAWWLRFRMLWGRKEGGIQDL